MEVLTLCPICRMEVELVERTVLRYLRARAIWRQTSNSPYKELSTDLWLASFMGLIHQTVTDRTSIISGRMAYIAY